MAEKIRIGILGAARIAEKYAISAFKSIRNGELVCIASRDPQKAQQIADKFKIEAEKSYDAILKREDISAVYIPLPPGLHEEWVIKAAKAGKHVLCEKSLTVSLESAKKMIDACRSNGVVLYEDFMCDYHPQHAKVLSLLQNGTVGQAFVFQGYFGFPLVEQTDIRYNIRYNKELGGGSLNDVGTYTIFMTRKMLMAEPMAVTGKLIFDEETGVDVQGSAYLEFSDKKFAFSAFGFRQVYQNNYTIWGDKGFVRVNKAYSIPPEAEATIDLVQNDGTKDISSQLKIQPSNHFALLFSDFCKTIIDRNESKRRIVYDKLLAQAKVMEALRVSAAENRKVELSEFAV